MIIIFSGSSGVGKNTVINELIAQNPNLSLMPTYTTRAKRDGETDGVPYFFVSTAEFKELLAQDGFYEHELIHKTNYYGTPKKVVDDIASQNKVCLKDIDVLGAMNLKQLLKDKIKVVTIYLYIDKQTLTQRLEGRGEKEIDTRLSRFDFELTFKDKYDYTIENIDLDNTVSICLDIIKKEQYSK